jgi:hypothetical protein
VKYFYIVLFFLLSPVAKACVNENTICHQQNEVLSDVSDYRTYVKFDLNYWTGNSSGYFEELNPKDQWDDLFRYYPKGRAIKNVESMVRTYLSNQNLTERKYSANNPINKDYIVHSFNLVVNVVQQLDNAGKSIFHVHSILKIKEPTISLRKRLSSSVVYTVFSQSLSSKTKAGLETTIYDSIESILGKLNEGFVEAHSYCKKNSCRKIEI